MATAKKDCICFHCKAEIKAGTKAEWFAHNVDSMPTHGLGKSHTLWRMVCSDEKACTQRRVHAFLLERVKHQEKEDQEVIEMARKVGANEEIIKKLTKKLEDKRTAMMNPDNFGKV